MLAPAEDQANPPLREDLHLSASAVTTSGEPSWVIHDAVVNRFYRIGWLEFECLLRWDKTPRQICAEIAAHTPLNPELEQVLGLRQFLQQHHLLRPDTEALARLQQRSEGDAWLSWKWWLHHYLFFRIPLLHPQRHLQGLAASLGWLFTPLTAWLVVLLSLTGVVLVLQQWGTFTTAVMDSFSASGVLSFALALTLAKTLHELGHALVATRLGVRVAHMGVAFVVLWPMLYTDTGESWKLRNARQRLAIASAGIVTELAIAGLATLGWALSDPGMLRNALLYLATTSWVLSLALNASPFMRFDGYFILSDLLDFPNLHERSGAIARTALRRGILGIAEPWPEAFPRPQRRLLIAFAIATWIYRLLLFLGIALAVYLMFFKLLGIFLFVVEIAWFVLLPVWRELKNWWQLRAQVPGRRRLLFWGVGALLVALLAVPWRTQVQAVGVARAEQQLRVFSPYPALLEQLRENGAVEAGDTLAVLDEPNISATIHSNEASIRGYQERLQGLMADPMGLAEKTATLQRLDVQEQELRSAHAEIARLQLKAPFAGRWLDVDPQWQAGQWIGSREPLGMLIDPSSWQVDAYVEQAEVHRLTVGNAVRFYPAGQTAAIDGTVLSIDKSRTNQLSHPLLASRFGGPVGVAEHNEALVPTASLFRVVVQLQAAPPSLHETLGQVQIDGEKRSVLAEGATHMAAVLLRESGF
ncbi:MAG: HlyD family efflux transporter periplasmic adaptor subunit [Pseudomonas sp.]